jgi:hypothetical protein
MLHIFDRPEVRRAGVSIVLPSFTLTARVGVPQINPTTESRLLELEAKVGNLESALERAEKEMKSHAVELVKVEREERASAIADVGNKLQAVVTGDIALQAAGAAYLVVGIVLTSIPDEFASLWN